MGCRGLVLSGPYATNDLVRTVAVEGTHADGPGSPARRRKATCVALDHELVSIYRRDIHRLGIPSVSETGSIA